MKQIIFIVVVAFGVALYFYPLSTLTAIGQHLVEQAQR